MHVVGKYLYMLWKSKQCSKCARKTFLLHDTSTTTNLNCAHKAGWAHGLLTLNSDPSVCMSQPKLRSDQAMFSQSSAVQLLSPYTLPQVLVLGCSFAQLSTHWHN